MQRAGTLASQRCVAAEQPAAHRGGLCKIHPSCFFSCGC